MQLNHILQKALNVSLGTPCLLRLPAKTDHSRCSNVDGAHVNCRFQTCILNNVSEKIQPFKTSRTTVL